MKNPRASENSISADSGAEPRGRIRVAKNVSFTPVQNQATLDVAVCVPYLTDDNVSEAFSLAGIALTCPAGLVEAVTKLLR